MALWSEGYENVITKGAVMDFENQNGLTVDGLAGARVWTELLADVASGKVDADPYTYVVVSKQLPESLTVFDNGAPALANIPVNTGAPGADTVDGTFPVFEHVTSSRMQGTNPDGTTYDDPNVPWAAYFNGGDALHGFVRATYGTPQSNGCVEMRISDAAKVWPLAPIGTLVTVVGPAFADRAPTGPRQYGRLHSACRNPARPSGSGPTRRRPTRTNARPKGRSTARAGERRRRDGAPLRRGRVECRRSSRSRSSTRRRPSPGFITGVSGLALFPLS